MGPLFFDYGFGPFRWVCTSGDSADLAITDELAAEVLEELMKSSPATIRGQMEDNLKWIREAGRNNLVVGSQARILYADAEGRVAIAGAFNKAIREGRISGPIVLGRDHHDVSGTDSPWRETSNIYDGSQLTADMAVQNFAGDSFRGPPGFRFTTGRYGLGRSHQRRFRAHPRRQLRLRPPPEKHALLGCQQRHCPP